MIISISYDDSEYKGEFERLSKCTFVVTPVNSKIKKIVGDQFEFCFNTYNGRNEFYSKTGKKDEALIIVLFMIAIKDYLQKLKS